jgi:hypothetical protein
VRRIVESVEAGPLGHKVRGHDCEQVVKIVRARIVRTQGRITAKRLLPEARAAGYEGSAHNFRRWSPRRRSTSAKATTRDDVLGSGRRERCS